MCRRWSVAAPRCPSSDPSDWKLGASNDCPACPCSRVHWRAVVLSPLQIPNSLRHRLTRRRFAGCCCYRWHWRWQRCKLHSIDLEAMNLQRSEEFDGVHDSNTCIQQKQQQAKRANGKMGIPSSYQ